MARTLKKHKPLIEPDPPIVLRLAPAVDLTEDQFFELCGINSELRMERTAEGAIIVMPPEGSDTGRQSYGVTGQFSAWDHTDGTGIGFSSSAGFTLPNGAVRSPDLSWIRRERWEALPLDQRKKFAPICPDFVVELRSPTDRLSYVQAKMQEYIDSGAQLGWLIDPLQRRLHIYRPGTPIVVLDHPDQASGEPLLPGFILDLRRLWAE